VGGGLATAVHKRGGMSAVRTLAADSRVDILIRSTSGMKPRRIVLLDLDQDSRFPCAPSGVATWLPHRNPNMCFRVVGSGDRVLAAGRSCRDGGLLACPLAQDSVLAR
jgi:hypothetical protein